MLDTKQQQISRLNSIAPPTIQAIIDGELTGAASGKTFAVVSPIDGATIAELPECDVVDVNRAVAGARKAFESAPLGRTVTQTA